MLYLFYVMYFVPATILIPVLIALKNYKALTKPLKVIFWFLILSGLSNLVNLILIAFHHFTAHLLSIYTIIEFFFLSLFYSCFSAKKYQNMMYVAIAVFTILCIVNFLFIQNKIEFNTYTRPVGAIILIIYSLLYISKQNNEEGNWGDNMYNWINAGILIYLASCLFMFIFSNYLLNAGQHVNQVVWSVHDTILILEYVLFAVGFYKCKTQPITSTY
ncbi:small-conductance mechanosensitive channel [Mucilaginibacter sp. AK015]|nr:small-conductance mechanosensitive channel [Mucilaginibacter sp. AK015]